MTGEHVTFIDTNVLAYAHDASETGKQPVARAQLEALWRARTGVLSTQVLQEFYAVATRKLAMPMHRTTARKIVALYAEWPVVQVDVPLVLAASELEERHTLSFWDALIVEAAARSGATRLLTEDLQPGRRIRRRRDRESLRLRRICEAPGADHTGRPAVLERAGPGGYHARRRATFKGRSCEAGKGARRDAVLSDASTP